MKQKVTNEKIEHNVDLNSQFADEKYPQRKFKLHEEATQSTYN